MDRELRRLVLLSWAAVLPLAVAESLISPAAPVTLLIESVAAAIYAGGCKRPLLPLLTVVALMNLLTQPMLWLVLVLTGGGWFALGWGELLVWGMEAVLLYLTQRQWLNWAGALGLSAALNLPSAVCGLFLPV